MTIYQCVDPDGGYARVDVDSEAPGEYAGQTLTCALPDTYDNDGYPVDGAVTFAAPSPPPATEEPSVPGGTVTDLGERVAAFLGQQDDPGLLVLASRHAEVITAMARAYTRRNGFYSGGPDQDDIEAVIVTATARLLANPEQLAHQVGGVAFRGGFSGWSLAELAVLNAYRRRAA